MPTLSVADIRRHYDRLSLLYRWYWGPHIHHGYWTASERPREAQENLLAELARQANLPPRPAVLDVGCGLGGGSAWLARNYGAQVTGVTLSAVQVALARVGALWSRTGGRTRFLRMDAHALRFPPASFDAVWVVECSEHLFDKPHFLRRCAELLRPGGVLAVAAWLRGPQPDEALLGRVLEGMLCPSLGSEEEYRRWIAAAGFAGAESRDVTERVIRTWDLCLTESRKPLARAAVAVSRGATRRFVESFADMRRALESGTMRYGLITARRPAHSSLER